MSIHPQDVSPVKRDAVPDVSSHKMCTSGHETTFKSNVIYTSPVEIM